MTAIGYPYYKGSPCVTTEIISGSRYDFPGVDHEGRQTCRLYPLH